MFNLGEFVNYQVFIIRISPLNFVSYEYSSKP